jgi:multidrug efflux pump subunit AcrA (membrane-fusion protein)
MSLKWGYLWTDLWKTGKNVQRGVVRKGKKVMKKKRWYLPLITGFLILALGVAGMFVLSGLKKAPVEAAQVDEEKVLHVAVTSVQPEDVAVKIEGYGQVRALKSVEIAPEVSGRVVKTHPALVVGGIVPQGEALFVIEPEAFEARVDDARALVGQWESALKRAELERTNEGKRLKALQRNGDLTQAQFDRTRQLLKEQVGSQAEVESMEQALVTANEQVDQMARSLQLYPIRIEETRNNLASAQAKLKLAELELAKTRVALPFAARVKSVSVQSEQYVTAGREIIQVVDDSILEISVPIDSRDARQWLDFNGTATGSGGAWFTELHQAPCKIHWTEEIGGGVWTGLLHRVEAFDPASRTLTVAIRISGEEAVAPESGNFPLVEGMFCQVEIPGRTMKNIFRLDSKSVSFENTIFIADEDKRLKTQAIKVARVQDGFTFISEGLEAGDQIVTTRLVNPLEHSLLDFDIDEEGAVQ